MEDIRWKQRFQNFEHSLQLLRLALDIEQPSVVEKAGLIQFFEVCFELSWKVLKDYLSEQGFSDLRYPRESIKKSFEVGLIEGGETWLEALQNRNLMAHTYDEKVADKVVADIRSKYFPVILAMYHKLKKEV